MVEDTVDNIVESKPSKNESFVDLKLPKVEHNYRTAHGPVDKQYMCDLL